MAYHWLTPSTLDSLSVLGSMVTSYPVVAPSLMMYTSRINAFTELTAKTKTIKCQSLIAIFLLVNLSHWSIMLWSFGFNREVAWDVVSRWSFAHRHLCPSKWPSPLPQWYHLHSSYSLTCQWIIRGSEHSELWTGHPCHNVLYNYPTLKWGHLYNQDILTIQSQGWPSL